MYVNVLIEYVAKGGYQFMVPLIILSIISLSVILERVYFLWFRCSIPDSDYHNLEKFLSEDDIEQALKVAENKHRLPQIIIADALKRFTDSERKLSFEQSVQKSADHYIGCLSRGFWLLRAVTYLSPMLGLLGTVVGLAASFGNIAEKGLNQQSVASGISMALITTIAGLTIALPTFFAESCLQAWAKARYEAICKTMDQLVTWYKK